MLFKLYRKCQQKKNMRLHLSSACVKMQSMNIWHEQRELCSPAQRIHHTLCQKRDLACSIGADAALGDSALLLGSS